MAARSGPPWSTAPVCPGPACWRSTLVTAGRWVTASDHDGDGSATLVLRDGAGLGGAAGELLLPVAPAAGSPTPAPLTGIVPVRLQIIPDAARTAVVSWIRDPHDARVPFESDINLLSLRDAAKRPGTLLLEGGGFVYPSGVYDRSDNSNRRVPNVAYDGSDGTHRLFVAGGAIGRPDNVLYRAKVEDLRRGPASAAPWEEVGTHPLAAEFKVLLFDPAGGGQHLFTIGFEGTLLESFNGGRSWQQDPTAPLISRLWLSPADGALYGLERGGAGFYADDPSFAGQGRPWKREPTGGVPPGARIYKGDLRVTCTGPGPVDPVSGLPLRAASPGSTFPLGNSTLTCSATDAFGNRGTGTIVVSVRDTTPPVITVDTAPAPASAPTGGTVPVTFGVSATDAVDGAVPVTCVPAAGAAFPIGVTTVTCTAADRRTPTANTSRTAFPVVVSRNGQPPLGPPTLTVPGDAKLEATGPSGASGATLAVTAATAGGAPLSPTCTPSLASTFPIGVTTVSCSATDPGASLTVTRAFTLTVRDTTAPTVTLPGDQTVAAQGAFGAHVSYVAQGTDVVDGAVAVTCAPPSGAAFPLGATVVKCRAVDAAGNQGFAQFKVLVTDQSQPLLHFADSTHRSRKLPRRPGPLQPVRHGHLGEPAADSIVCPHRAPGCRSAIPR